MTNNFKQTEISLRSIIDSFNKTKNVFENLSLPKKQGIYCICLKDSVDFKNFISKYRVAYIGIAKRNLNSREVKQHFNDKKTGWSTLRRSVGAIYKNELNLKCYPREKINFSHYIFNSEREQKVTALMTDKFLLGYYAFNKTIEYELLRAYEEKLIRILKPFLDLDKRTRFYNKFSNQLLQSRKICSEEAKIHYEQELQTN